MKKTIYLIVTIAILACRFCLTGADEDGGCPAEFSTAVELFCHMACGDDWLDDEEGCQQADADAFCKLTLCDEDAFATDYEETFATIVPGFACGGEHARGKDYGDWFGIEGVHFSNDTRKTNGFGKVVSNVSCNTMGPSPKGGECEDKDEKFCLSYVRIYGDHFWNFCEQHWFIGEDGRYGCRKSCNLC